MAVLSRIEINFNRLLHQCQAMADDKENRDWRFEKYIGSLQSFLSDLKKSQSKPSQETLLEYQKQVELLKGLSEAEKKPCVAERALITERLRPVSTKISSAPSRHLQAKAKATCEKDVRAELLGKSHDADGLRHRGHNEDEEDMNQMLKHHRELQEKAVEEMLGYTHQMKQNFAAAGRVVRDDTRKISESTKLADTNLSKLKVQSERLEAHNKTCSWWIWIMLVMVICTFISMVLFMRMFSKPS